MCRFDPAQQQDKDNLEKVVSNLDNLYGLALAKGESMTLPKVVEPSLESRLAALTEEH